MKCDTIPELERFLTIQEQALGNGSAEVASTVSKLADLYLDRGRLDDAEALYRRAISIREGLSGPHRSEVEESRKSLNKVLALKGDRLVRISAEMRAAGSSSVRQGRPAQSGTGGNVNSQPVQSARPDVRYVPPNQSPYQPPFVGHAKAGAVGAQPQSALGKYPAAAAQAQSASGKYSAVSQHTKSSDSWNFRPLDSSTTLEAVPDSMALSSSEDALLDAIKEARVEIDLMRQLSGCDTCQLADRLTRLADLLCRCKRYKEMEPLLIEALSIREKRYGHHHQMVATSLKNLARLYYFQGYFDRSLPLFERTLTIRRTVFGEHNPRVAETLEQFAKLLRKMERHAEALKVEQEAQSIRARSQGWRPL
ncbi:MAG: tetratricopeptide repeat protein [Candidatus Obscuribacterales bacterium]|nr:tetratricopeptide repeat protein [Candidatus Obscuribacterales bacterium]